MAMPQTENGAGSSGVEEMSEVSEEEKKRLMAVASGWTPDFSERRALEIAFSSVFVA